MSSLLEPQLKNFISNLSSKKRETIMLSLMLLCTAYGDEFDKSELMYLDFYGNLLDVDRKRLYEKMYNSKNLSLVDGFAEFTILEKAFLIFILRGIANIDFEASVAELNMIDSIARLLKFNFQEFFDNPKYDRDTFKLSAIMKELILPIFRDVVNGGKLIYELSQQTIDKIEAEDLYSALVFHFEFAPVRNLENFTAELNHLELD